MRHRQSASFQLRIAALVVSVLASSALLALREAGPAGASVTGAAVTPFGDAPNLGGLGDQQLARAVVGAARTPSGNGYWLVAVDGGIFSFGDAKFFGSTGAITLNQPIVGIAATPTGLGYWLVARDGGIFSFGDAKFFGSTGDISLNQPIVGIAATPTGLGYWMVARDGGIFAFGDALFLGSTGATTLNQPIVAMSATSTGNGYWFVASDGGIFAYGDAAFFGSTGAMTLNEPITTMTPTPDNQGYWLVARDGGIFAYGNAQFRGTVSVWAPDYQAFALLSTKSGNGYWEVTGPDPALPTLQKGDSGDAVAEMQRQLQGLGYWLADPSGTYGYTTEQAMYAFQKVEGLSRTGKFDGPSRARLKTAVRPKARNSGDLVEVDKGRQVLFVVRNGKVTNAFNTSTGTERPYTFEGRTYVAHTEEGSFHVSSVYRGVQEGRLGDLYNPRYYNSDGEAVHGSNSVPPTPASHGCVRVSNQAIDWIWENNIMPMGSSVVVYP